MPAHAASALDRDSCARDAAGTYKLGEWPRGVRRETIRAYARIGGARFDQIIKAIGLDTSRGRRTSSLLHLHTDRPEIENRSLMKPNPPSSFSFQRDYFGPGYHLLEHEQSAAALFLDDQDFKSFPANAEPTKLWYHLISRVAGGKVFLEKVVGSTKSSDMKPSAAEMRKALAELRQALSSSMEDHK